MKQATRLALVATMLATVSAVSMAATDGVTGGKITFTGKVTDQTCVVTIDGKSGDVNVKLPTVQKSQLSAVGTVAGRTPFVVTISDCKAGVDTAVNVTLTNPTLASNGTLANTASDGAAKGVALQLLPDMTGINPFVLTSQSHLPGLMLGPNDTEVSHEFAVQYIRYADNVDPGTVQAVVNYDITYP